MKGPLSTGVLTNRPVIGLTPYVEQAKFGPWDRSCALIPETYIRQVEMAGAVPVVLPPSRDADAVTRLLDGVVLAGGPDVDPVLYDADRHELTDRPRTERDLWELAVLSAARRRRVPVLGICRGMQLINVACGGDLVQALEGTPHAALHRAELGVFGSHRVRLAPQSWCGSVLGGSVDVATHHHQAIRTVGSSLTPVAWADDGCVEALEGNEGSLLIGVQWHPEEESSSRLFEQFVDVCATPAGESLEVR